MSTLDELIAKYADTPESDFAELTIEIGEVIWSRMEHLGVTRTELARRMGVSRARVTQVLSGADNLTLKTLVGVANALDTTWSMELHDRAASEKDPAKWKLLDITPSYSAGNRALAQAT